MARTYAELRTDIADWLIASDATAKIATFVRLAEDRHKWGMVEPTGKRADYQGAIRVRDMESKARAFGNNTRYLNMPTGVLEHKTLSPVVNGVVGRPFKFLGVQQFGNMVRQPSGNTINYYTIERNEFKFDAPLADTSQVEIVSYLPFSPLVEDTDTNWLLENCYHAYLYGALCEAEPYLQDNRLALWEAQYAKAVRALNATERAAQSSKSANTTYPLRRMP